MSKVIRQIETTLSQTVFDAVASSAAGLTTREIFEAAKSAGYSSENTVRATIEELKRTEIFDVEKIVGAKASAGQSTRRYKVRQGVLRPVRRAQHFQRRSAIAVNNILELFHQGETLQSIGQKYGITRERVRQILAKQGVAVTRERTISDLVKRVQQLEIAVFGKALPGNGATIIEFLKSDRRLEKDVDERG